METPDNHTKNRSGQGFRNHAMSNLIGSETSNSNNKDLASGHQTSLRSSQYPSSNSPNKRTTMGQSQNSNFKTGGSA